MDEKHIHLKYKICVSGAAETGHCAPDTLEKAKIIGRAIVEEGAVLVTGATTGFPMWSAMGAKEANGFSIGLSPATSEKDHVEKYNLPLDYMDVIIYTGFGYSGRNLLLTRAADAIIVGCGRWGTLNEFTIALEDGKPIGVLDGAGGSTEVVRDIIEKSNRGPGNIVYDADPKSLVAKVLELIKKEKSSRYY
ncbi:LOG family protein [Candidatus Giovannonibacteria bacterium]|nr:LOG family protein [Candidatus Giovannonibacteria bacterium]